MVFTLIHKYNTKILYSTNFQYFLMIFLSNIKFFIKLFIRIGV